MQGNLLIRNENWLDREGTARLIGVSIGWLEKNFGHRDAPGSVRYGRKCWYKRSHVEAWLRRKQAEPDRTVGELCRLGMLGNLAMIRKWSAERTAPPPDEKVLEALWAEEIGPPKWYETAEPEVQQLAAQLTPKQLDVLRRVYERGMGAAKNTDEPRVVPKRASTFAGAA